MNNSAEYAAAFFGVLLAKGIVLPLPPDLEAERKNTILEMTQCGWIIDKPQSDAVRICRTKCQSKQAKLEIPPDLAAVFFTSGSTGTPKGVMLSHRNFLSNAQAIQRYLGIGSADKALALLPFFHAFGNSVLQSHLLAGATLVVEGTLTYPNSVVEAMARHGVSSFSGVPEFFQMLLKHSRLGQVKLPCLRYAAAAGGSLRPEIAREVAARIAPAQLFLMYGQTEATARLSYLPPELLESKPGCIGRGIPGVRLEVVHEDGRPVMPGETGQIRAQGPGIMLGYWNDVAATNAVLRDGWLHTGDLATVDEEGFIYPQGRANALCKIAGYRVHPAEIETVITRHFSGEAVVVPFELGACGTRLALYFVPTASQVTVTAEAIRAVCLQSLPRHLLPTRIEVIDRWPLTSACKVDRLALSALAEEVEQVL